jgi:hypothetical protein
MMRFGNHTDKFTFKLRRRIFSRALPVLILLLFVVSAASVCHAALLDRVIAYVDDRAITYSELRDRHSIVQKTAPDITEEETLNSMINALLMLQKAKKMRFEAPTEDDLIKEYMEVNIKSRISVGEDKIREYYDKNKPLFKNQEFAAVREEIERYLIELETNIRLKEHLKELRTDANIVIRLKYK